MYCTTSYRHLTSGLINILDLSIVCCFCKYGSLYCPLHHAACTCARVPSPIMFSSSAETVRSDDQSPHLRPALSFALLCACTCLYAQPKYQGKPRYKSGTRCASCSFSTKEKPGTLSAFPLVLAIDEGSRKHESERA